MFLTFFFNEKIVFPVVPQKKTRTAWVPRSGLNMRVRGNFHGRNGRELDGAKCLESWDDGNGVEEGWCGPEKLASSQASGVHFAFVAGGVLRTRCATDRVATLRYGNNSNFVKSLFLAKIPLLLIVAIHLLHINVET